MQYLCLMCLVENDNPTWLYCRHKDWELAWPTSAKVFLHAQESSYFFPPKGFCPCGKNFDWDKIKSNTFWMHIVFQLKHDWFWCLTYFNLNSTKQLCVTMVFTPEIWSFFLQKLYESCDKRSFLIDFLWQQKKECFPVGSETWSHTVFS